MKKLVKILFSLMILVGFLYFENHFIVVDRLTFKTANKINIPVKIMHLSDLHGQRIENIVSSFKKKFSQESPDLVLITGDTMSDSKEDSFLYIDYLKRVFQETPVYYVDGNHEHSNYKYYSQFTEYMEANNFINISNDSKFIKINDNNIYLAGIQDPLFYSETTDGMVKERIKTVDKATANFKILLSHRSEYTPLYNNSNFDLILTGHAHGGVIGIPFTQGNLYSSAEGFFPKYTKGLHDKTYISRGLGGSRFSFRLFNHPQISIITLKS